MRRTFTETRSCSFRNLSREAAKECSPRRKPWEPSETETIPVGTAEPTAHPCHPERSLAKSKVICRTESKDPYHVDVTSSHAGSFHIAIRFFDDHDAEVFPESTREAAKWESQARKCRVSTLHTTESRRDATTA